MFNVENLRCIYAEFKEWLDQLVDELSHKDDDDPMKHDQPKETNSAHDLKDRLTYTSAVHYEYTHSGISSEKNLFPWHIDFAQVVSRSVASGSFPCSPGEPHSGFRGIPDGNYRRSWQTLSSRRSKPLTSRSTIHQTSFPCGFSKTDKPSRHHIVQPNTNNNCCRDDVGSNVRCQECSGRFAVFNGTDPSQSDVTASTIFRR